MFAARSFATTITPTTTTSSRVSSSRRTSSSSSRGRAATIMTPKKAIEGDDAKSMGYGDKENMSESMKAFAEEGYPSDEDDIKDPRERDRAMKEAVGDVLAMAQSEADVINQAYDLIEKLSPGLKMKNRPPRSGGEEKRED